MTLTALSRHFPEGLELMFICNPPPNPTPPPYQDYIDCGLHN